jgi:signal transduction histidine kinase
VTVRASTDEGLLRVEVTDNGPGFTSTELPVGHGLDLLRSRLAMSFGDRASLRIDSHPGQTTVTLELQA